MKILLRDFSAKVEREKTFSNQLLGMIVYLKLVMIMCLSDKLCLKKSLSVVALTDKVLEMSVWVLVRGHIVHFPKTWCKMLTYLQLQTWRRCETLGLCLTNFRCGQMKSVLKYQVLPTE
jgi:hypothetical protein